MLCMHRLLCVHSQVPRSIYAMPMHAGSSVDHRYQNHHHRTNYYTILEERTNLTVDFFLLVFHLLTCRNGQRETASSDFRVSSLQFGKDTPTPSEEGSEFRRFVLPHSMELLLCHLQWRSTGGQLMVSTPSALVTSALQNWHILIGIKQCYGYIFFFSSRSVQIFILNSVGHSSEVQN